MSRSISSFSVQSFHLSSAVGPIAMNVDKGGEEDGLAHMHLDSVSISNSANQSTASAISSSLASSLTDEGEADASSEGESEGAEADIGAGGNAPSFLLADGTPEELRAASTAPSTLSIRVPLAHAEQIRTKLRAISSVGFVEITGKVEGIAHVTAAPKGADDIFAAVAAHILSIRENAATYPIYLTAIVPVGMDNQQTWSTINLLKFKKRLENQINIAVQQLAYRA